MNNDACIHEHDQIAVEFHVGDVTDGINDKLNLGWRVVHLLALPNTASVLVVFEFVGEL